MTGILGADAEVTVLLAHRDCAWGLERAVRSILEQTLTAVELVLVDDYSEDPGAMRAVVRHARDPRLVPLRTTRNVGQFRIYSRLLPRIASPLLSFQDADDRSAADRLERLRHALEWGGWDVLGSAVARRDRAGRALETFRPPADVNRACAWRRRGGAVSGPSTLCRTDFVRRLGGYDATTLLGGDTDFAFRAVFAGRIGNLPEPLYEATVHPASLTASPATGFGSPVRRRYLRAISRRFYRNLLRSKLGPVPIGRLQARPCDVDFDIVPLEI